MHFVSDFPCRLDLFVIMDSLDVLGSYENSLLPSQFHSSHTTKLQTVNDHKDNYQ